MENEIKTKLEPRESTEQKLLYESTIIMTDEFKICSQGVEQAFTKTRHQNVPKGKEKREEMHGGLTIVAGTIYL